MSDPAPAGRRPPLIGLLLLAATGLHIAAIIFPFVSMRTLLSTYDYGLIPSVLMLFDYGMAALAVLVIIFSIIFPFAKLAVLWCAWNASGPQPLLGRLVHLAERLGRASMLDVFLVLLLLTVTAGQTLVASTPLIGMPCFLGGVLCSMVAGAVLARRWPGPAAPRLASTPRTWLLLGILAACLLAAQLVPVLSTDSLLVSDRDFSLFGVALALTRNGQWGLACAVGGGLLLLPWLTWGAYALAVLRGGDTGRARALANWSMLDVFAIALAIFVAESANAVPSVLSAGAIALFLGIAIRPVALRLCRDRPAVVAAPQADSKA